MKTASIALVCMFAASVGAETLRVGAGHPFASIEKAHAKAQPGDVIEVHPRADGAAYSKVALTVSTKNITFRGVTKDKSRIRIDGTGFDYSGAGPVPRAIFEFRKGADGCRVENFELFNARNSSANGAGVRINEANGITIENCEIHHCDNGAMSNGNLRTNTASDQRFLDCHVHHNGSADHFGKTHNFYLGGTSVLLRGCRIHDSTVGHNFKSRAHTNRIEACWIQDAAQREIDIPDDPINTAAPNSDTVVIGCVILKKRETEGNRGVFFLGSDSGAPHDGTLHVVHCTIAMPYAMGLVVVTRAESRVRLHNNIVWSDGVWHGSRAIAESFGTGKTANVSGSRNWFCFGYAPGRNNGLSSKDNLVGGRGESPPFRDAENRDFRLKEARAGWVAQTVPLEDLGLSGVTELRRYESPVGSALREDRAMGALPAP